MTRAPARLASLAAALTAPAASADEPAREQAAFFESKVRPVLVERCLGCHGPEKQKGGLRLDSEAGWRAGGERGPAVVPGKPDESPLVKAVRGADGFERMPPDKPLPA